MTQDKWVDNIVYNNLRFCTLVNKNSKIFFLFFAQIENLFMWSHDRETVTYRNSAHLINTLLQNYDISNRYIKDFDLKKKKKKKKIMYCTVMDRSISYTHWRFRRHFPLSSVIKYKIYYFCSFLKTIPKFNDTAQYKPIRRPISSRCGGFQPLGEFFCSFGKKQAINFLKSFLKNNLCIVITLEHFEKNSNSKTNILGFYGFSCCFLYFLDFIDLSGILLICLGLCLFFLCFLVFLSFPCYK